MSGTKGMLHYSVEIKRKAVELFLEEHHSYRAIAKALGIGKPARIKVWVRLYRREGEGSFSRPIGRPRNEEREQRELERLRMENALLKKFRAELREVSLVQRNIG
jgi:transposase-like protein